MSIALHACCGPCLIEPLEVLSAQDDVVVVYANPNIAPPDEYYRRRDTLLQYASKVSARVVELAYEPARWTQMVAGREHDKPARCAACYRLRLTLVAEWAAEHGFSHLATTLTVSPFQDPDAIREAGEEVADATGLSYLHTDFRDKYGSATARARELGLYRQNYCGCLFSRDEAEQDRESRRSQRAAARLERNKRLDAERPAGQVSSRA
jgi:predicted adenine nucleotide alpha hydrolase (AANH) superfamily ATPase